MAAPHDPLPADVVDALRRGHKIEAIKLLREHTGIGLKEAKDRVESDERGPGGRMPGSSLTPTNSRAWVWLLVVVVVAVLGWLMLRAS